MFRLPPTNHAAREAMGDIRHVAEMLDYRNVGKLPGILKARRDALAYLAAEPRATAVNAIIIRADTAERWLVRIGRRGGWRKLWNFGDGRPVAA
jgi:hypothetical protein